MLFQAGLALMGGRGVPEGTEGIRWPDEFSPVRSPIHVRNQLAMVAPARTVWAWLIRAREWPSWYSNSKTVRIEGGGADLTLGTTFRWRTFGVALVSRVEEFIPLERLAWNARGLGVCAYHAWLIVPNASGCTVVTEETQRGLVSRAGKLFMPGRMERFHQMWLEELEKKARQGPPSE
jgi:hypothetical protein